MRKIYETSSQNSIRDNQMSEWPGITYIHGLQCGSPVVFSWMFLIGNTQSLHIVCRLAKIAYIYRYVPLRTRALTINMLKYCNNTQKSLWFGARFFLCCFFYYYYFLIWLTLHYVQDNTHTDYITYTPNNTNNTYNTKDWSWFTDRSLTHGPSLYVSLSVFCVYLNSSTFRCRRNDVWYVRRNRRGPRHLTYHRHC